MRLFYHPNIEGHNCELDAEESRHCVKVLRKKVGDSIKLTDGKGHLMDAVLTQISSRQCTYRIIKTIFEENTAPDIHIAIAPTKSNDRIEWFVEKAVEIGVRKISFIRCHHSERTHINLTRLQKKAISAMKQSLRYHLPYLSGIEKFEQLIAQCGEQQRFMAHLENDSTPSLLQVAKTDTSSIILIGPEGGFSEDEVANGRKHRFDVVKIGDHRLRTETAGVVACTLLNLPAYQR